MLSDKERLGKLNDSLVEHQPDDPGFGPPESWPEWTDDVIVDLGGPCGRDETFDDASGFEPSQEDWEDYFYWSQRLEYDRRFGDNPSADFADKDWEDYCDWCERLEYEREFKINMRFV